MSDIIQKNGFNFKVIDNEHNYVQIGTGTSDNYNACAGECPKSISIPQSIDYNGVNYTVTEISSKAFFGAKLESVFISKTIEVIGIDAFNTVNASKFEFEQGSKLKVIKARGIGWINSPTFVLPPSIEKLDPDSLRGFISVKNFYFCGTTSIDTENVLSEVKNIKIHVTPQYPSDHFSNMSIFNHNLNCDLPFYCQTIQNNRLISQRFTFISLFFLTS